MGRMRKGNSGSGKELVDGSAGRVLVVSQFESTGLNQ